MTDTATADAALDMGVAPAKTTINTCAVEDAPKVLKVKLAGHAVEFARDARKSNLVYRGVRNSVKITLERHTARWRDTAYWEATTRFADGFAQTASGDSPQRALARAASFSQYALKEASKEVTRLEKRLTRARLAYDRHDERLSLLTVAPCKKTAKAKKPAKTKRKG